jgi:anti-sigma regulatory factor (Ser/Thr protein kinase)
MPDAATIRLDPELSCAGAARQFVLEAVNGWDRSRFGEDAALCASELATNAILHSRHPFTVSVRPIRQGVRIDVHDDRPDRLPIAVPDQLSPLDVGITGRGLKLVAAMAARWGYFTTDVAKTVWVELADWGAGGSPPPEVEVAARPEPEGTVIRIIGLPVKVAVASGVQIDSLVRQLQLDPSGMADSERATFEKLLDQSAAVRLIGRQEAFRAAGRRRESYDLELIVSPDELTALAELDHLLRGLDERWSEEVDPVPSEVTAMRAWLGREVAAQLAGHPPTPYGSTIP